MKRTATIHALAGAGLLLATLTAAAQDTSGSCGSAPSDALQADVLCGGGSGSAAVAGPTGSGGSAVAPRVQNDPLGTATRPSTTPGPGDLLDNRATSAIPDAPRPRGMAPLVVPNDPLGNATRPRVPSGASPPVNGNSGISSPSIQ